MVHFFNYAIHSRPEVEKYQIRQTKVDQIIINLVVTSNFDYALEGDILAQLNEYCGEMIYILKLNM